MSALPPEADMLATVLQLPVRAGVTEIDAQPQNSSAVVDFVAQAN